MLPAGFHYPVWPFDKSTFIFVVQVWLSSVPSSSAKRNLHPAWQWLKADSCKRICMRERSFLRRKFAKGSELLALPSATRPPSAEQVPHAASCRHIHCPWTAAPGFLRSSHGSQHFLKGFKFTQWWQGHFCLQCTDVVQRRVVVLSLLDQMSAVSFVVTWGGRVGCYGSQVQWARWSFLSCAPEKKLVDFPAH